MARLSVPELSFECALVFMSGDRQKGEYYARLNRVRPPAAEAGKQWAHCNLNGDPAAEQVFCLRRASKTMVPKKQQNQWFAARMEVLDLQALERK